MARSEVTFFRSKAFCFSNTLGFNFILLTDFLNSLIWLNTLSYTLDSRWWFFSSAQTQERATALLPLQNFRTLLGQSVFVEQILFGSSVPHSKTSIGSRGGGRGLSPPLAVFPIGSAQPIKKTIKNKKKNFSFLATH